MNLFKVKNLPHVRNLICAIFMITITVLPFKIFAIGQTTDPIVIKNAVRGNEYQKTMTVINTEKKNVKITFSAEGQIGKWAKFYALDNYTTALNYVDMKSGEARAVNVVFVIPSDTPNGTYKGFVSALLKPDSSSVQEGSSTSVSQKIDREVTIEIGGKEVVSFDVSVIPKSYDLQKNEILSIRFIYDNKGNVSITPQAQLRITPLLDNSNTGEKSVQAVYNTIYPYPENQPAVKAGAIHEISAVEIPTSNFIKGKYVVDMSFMEKGKIISEKKFVFSSDVFEPVVSNKNLNVKANLLGVIGMGNGINNSLAVSILAIAVILGLAYLVFHKKLLPKKINHGKN